jgi:hypothetical protein
MCALSAALQDFDIFSDMLHVWVLLVVGVCTLLFCYSSYYWNHTGVLSVFLVVGGVSMLVQDSLMEHDTSGFLLCYLIYVLNYSPLPFSSSVLVCALLCTLYTVLLCFAKDTLLLAFVVCV